MNAVDIFIAYSHNDLRYKDELKKFLRPLLNTGQARVWDDYEIEAGKDWEAEIKTRLYSADIILLLVSPDSLASEYFYGKEVAVSLERHEKGEAVVAPVILRPCAWTITPLKKIEAMPEKAKPITSWLSQDEAFTDVAHRLSEMVERLQTERASQSHLAAQKRHFGAVVEAADHLFQKENWAEAYKAYTEAISFSQPGFTPDAATLKRQLEECKKKEKEAATFQAFKERQSEFENVVSRAQYLEQAGNWQQACVLFQQAIKRFENGFEPNVESLRNRINFCEQEIHRTAEEHALSQQLAKQYLKFLTDAERHLRRQSWEKASEAVEQALLIRPDDAEALRLQVAIAQEKSAADNRAANSTQKKNYIMMAVFGSVILLVVAIAIWQVGERKKVVEDGSIGKVEPEKTPPVQSFQSDAPKPDTDLPQKQVKKPPVNDAVQTPSGSSEKKKTVTDPSGPPADADSDDAVAKAAFDKLRRPGAMTIPALEGFLKQYPQSRQASDAQKLLTSKKRDRDKWLETADLYIQIPDVKEARSYLEKVIAIDPNNRAAQTKLNNLKNK